MYEYIHLQSSTTTTIRFFSRNFPKREKIVERHVLDLTNISALWDYFGNTNFEGGRGKTAMKEGKIPPLGPI